jgi:hypothetical protein
LLDKDLKMENVIVTSIPQSVLTQARHDLVKGIKKTGDLIGNYANGLCAGFNVVSTTGELVKPWYELRGKDAKGIKAERAAFVEEMKEAGYNQGTIDVYWGRVKVASGYQTTGMRVAGNQSTDEKNRAELKTIINRIFKAEESGEDCESSDFKGQLMDVFAGLGGDVDTLG